MAITFAKLQELLKNEKLRFFVAPDEPLIQFGIAGLFGKYDIMIRLYDDGTFLQIRNVGYNRCPADHPHLTAVLRLLGQINYQKRLVKFGWDPADGEIMTYADIWLMDNEITQQQFHRMLGMFLPAVDMANLRIQKTLESGVDPGEPDAETVAKLLSAAGGAPPKMPTPLKDLLDKLRGGKKPEDGPGSGPEKVTEV